MPAGDTGPAPHQGARRRAVCGSGGGAPSRFRLVAVPWPCESEEDTVAFGDQREICRARPWSRLLFRSSTEQLLQIR